jgi:hypothetical protein
MPKHLLEEVDESDSEDEFSAKDIIDALEIDATEEENVLQIKNSNNERVTDVEWKVQEKSLNTIPESSTPQFNRFRNHGPNIPRNAGERVVDVWSLFYAENVLKVLSYLQMH